MIGIDNGQSWVLTIISSQMDDKKIFDEVARIIFEDQLNKIDYSSVINEMDSYYREGANLKTPIICAYSFVKKKFKGYSKTKLDSVLSGVKFTHEK